MNTAIRMALFGACALLARPLWAEDVEITRSVAPNASVEVSNVAGEIIISTWDKNEVHLQGSLGKRQEVEVHESSSGIRFEVKNKNGDDNNFDEANLEIFVPAGASIVAEGISADIGVSGAAGESVVAESVSGDVDVMAEVDRVDLSSVSGDIEFGGAAGRGTFETVSGDIDAHGVSGEVSISTVSGDGTLVAGVLERAHFETVSGTLTLALSLAPGGRLTAEAMSGDVLLTLPRDQEGEFNVQTFSGDIRTAFGQVEDESFGPGSHLKHVSGDSGAQFRIESFSGDVRIGH
jgi:DUF4097 and DUF4098 domain-containing protein YvlB